jgi:Na+/melibiose symporter-like transporter
LKKGALYAPLYLVAFAAGVLSAFAWNRLAARLGKKMAWSLGMAVALAAAVATSFLTPANANAWSIGAVLLANTIGLVSFEVLPASILGDVSDYSVLKNGRNQTGSYFSLFMFATKVLFALGGAIGLALASRLGFDPKVAMQGAAGVQALSVVMSWLPAILLAISLPAILLIPMDQRRHAIVLKRLEQRNARASRTISQPACI